MNPSITHATSSPVVHRNIPDPDYRAIRALSKSSLTEFLRSPAHYLASTEKPKETTDAMMFGTAYHTYVLTPERFGDNVVLKPDWDARTKEGKAIKAEFEASLGRKVYIKPEQLDVIKAMKDALLAHPVAAKLLAEATDTEMAIECDYHYALASGGKADDVVRIKGLLDGWCNGSGTIFDLKTCKDSSPQGFKYAVKDFRYDLQEAQYRVLINSAEHLLNKRAERFLWVAQEKEPPYAPAVYELSLRTRLNAFDEWNLAVGNFAKCQKQNVWPGYSTDVVELEVVLG